MSGVTDDVEDRVALMRTSAAATDAELASALAALEPLPPMTEVRPPESGLVMLRGRMGGDGLPFNLGEATVTRATVTLESGEVGVSYLLGRRIAAARAAACIDALGQVPDWRNRIEGVLVAPVAVRTGRERAAAAARAAATRVEFFTLVRGEDQKP